MPLAFYLAHPVGHHVLRANPWDALWICYLANLVLALGLLLRSPHVASIALLWLLLGNAMWTLHLAGGGAFTPIELLPHVGGLTMAVVAVARLGFPAGSWYRAFLAAAGCVLLCRWLTPTGPNVNLAHGVWSGWEETFPSHFWYMVLIGATVLTGFLLVELMIRRLFLRASANQMQRRRQ